MKLHRAETELYRLPLPRPVPLPGSQEPRSARFVDVLLVRLITDNGPTAIGFSYALGGGGLAVRQLVDELLLPVLSEDDLSRTERLHARCRAELSAVGCTGPANLALAAVDFALWDAKGKQAGLPLHQLLGGYRSQIKAIVSDTATPALGIKQAVQQTRQLLDAGAAGLLIEIGTQDPDMDVERVRQLREALPDGVWFEVNGCGRYDAATAVAMGSLLEEEVGIDGFAEPVADDDFRGLNKVCDRLGVSVGFGANFDRTGDFIRLLNQGGVAAVRIDPCRLGGITPTRKVVAAAELRQVAVVPVRLPQVGVHLGCGSLYGRVGEYVDWFSELFADGPQFANGQLVPSDKAGLGIELNDAVAGHYRM